MGEVARALGMIQKKIESFKREVDKINQPLPTMAELITDFPHKKDCSTSIGFIEESGLSFISLGAVGVHLELLR